MIRNSCSAGRALFRIGLERIFLSEVIVWVSNSGKTNFVIICITTIEQVTSKVDLCTNYKVAIIKISLIVIYQIIWVKVQEEVDSRVLDKHYKEVKLLNNIAQQIGKEVSFIILRICEKT